MMVEERKDGSPKGRDPSSRGSVYDSRPFGGVRPTTGNAQITEQLVDQMTEALRPARKDRMTCAMPPRHQTTT